MLRRQTARRIVDLNDYEEEDEDYLPDVNPFDLKLEFSKEELNQLEEAFNQLVDSEGKISFFEVFHKIENNNTSGKENIVQAILKRIVNFKEVSGDRRVNF